MENNSIIALPKSTVMLLNLFMGSMSKLLKYSADNGYAEAQYSYAVILQNSSDYYLKEDDIMYYLRMASKQGHAEAKELLRKTNKYQKGIDVIKDRSDF